VRAWLAIACLAGCNQLLGINGTEKQKPDAAIDAPPPSDDEDGDGIANEHDDCPGIYDPTQVDSDGDGVGDLCDPHPGTPGDSLVMAEYFNGPTYSWTPDLAANWRIDATGTIVTTQTPETTQASLQWTALPAVAEPTLELGFTIVAYANPAVPLNRHMDLDFNVPNDLAVCQLVTNGPMGPEVNGISQTINGGTNSYAGLPSGLPAGQASRWWYTFDGSGGTCSLNGLAAVDHTPPTGPLPNMTLSVSAFQVSVQYALLYTFKP
jgi:hypothetical protein